MEALATQKSTSSCYGIKKRIWTWDITIGGDDYPQDKKKCSKTTILISHGVQDKRCWPRDDLLGSVSFLLSRICRCVLLVYESSSYLEISFVQLDVIGWKKSKLSPALSQPPTFINLQRRGRTKLTQEQRSDRAQWHHESIYPKPRKNQDMHICRYTYKCFNLPSQYW